MSDEDNRFEINENKKILSSKIDDICIKDCSMNQVTGKPSVCFENEKIYKNSKTDASSSSEYYAMKSKTKSGEFKRPAKIEFQMVNRQIKHNIRKSKYSLGHSRHCQNCSSHNYPQNHTLCQMTSNGTSTYKIIPENTAKPKEKEGTLSKVLSFLSPATKSNDSSSKSGKSDISEKNAKKHTNELKTEYYQFDHGDDNYLITTDKAPQLASDHANEVLHNRATKFWAEFFGTLNVAVTFILVFFVQFYRFILYSIVRTVFVGLIQMTSDYLLKPILTISFNGIIQPIFVFFRNIFQSLWNTIEPLAEMILGIFVPFIEFLRAIRLIDVYYYYGAQQSRHVKEKKEEECDA